jgi:hypothetical protein
MLFYNVVRLIVEFTLLLALERDVLARVRRLRYGVVFFRRHHTIRGTQDARETQAVEHRFSFCWLSFFEDR